MIIAFKKMFEFYPKYLVKRARSALDSTLFCQRVFLIEYCTIFPQKMPECYVRIGSSQGKRKWKPTALFTVCFAHLHYIEIQHVCQAISGCFVVLARDCLASTFDYVVMHMSKANSEKAYCPQTGSWVLFKILDKQPCFVMWEYSPPHMPTSPQAQLTIGCIMFIFMLRPNKVYN